MSKITQLFSIKSAAGRERRDGPSDRSRRAIMHRCALIFLIILSILSVACAPIVGTVYEKNIAKKAPASTTTKKTTTSTLVKSGYVNVGGLKMYYEIHGTIHGADKPLVLLHGGGGNIPNWGPTLPALAKSREVIAFELEGHGRTVDLDRPMSFDQMTDDVAAAVRKLGFDKVDVMGYSLGGTIALRMGMKYPLLVRKLVVISGEYSNDGQYPPTTTTKPAVQNLGKSQEEKDYDRLAPDPSRWPIFSAKLFQAFMGFKGWPESEVRSIKAPALIIFSDNDVIRPEYEVQLFKMLGGDKASGGASPLVSQMAVLPNTTHYTEYTKADLLIPIINPFLDTPMPK